MTAPEHRHKWSTLASWPSGPDGETDRLVTCTVPDCGQQYTRTHEEDDDGLVQVERMIRDTLDAYVAEHVDVEAGLREIKRRAGYGD